MALTWTKVQTRIERAHEGLETGAYTVRLESEAAGATRYRVAYKRTSYVVAFDENCRTGTCTCPDFCDTRGPACKHTAMVVLDQWPDSFDRWCGQVRALCAGEPALIPYTPPADRIEAMIHQVVHDALSAMEGQLVDRLVREVHATVEGILAE